MANIKLSPHLVVAAGDRAIAFYQAAFGATEVSCHKDGRDKIVHADLLLDGFAFSLADENPEWNALGPIARGGSPVVMTLSVDADVDALWGRAVAAGASVIYPIADQFYGARSGRIADPFGHQWMITMETEKISDEYLHRRMLAWEAEHAAKSSAS